MYYTNFYYICYLYYIHFKVNIHMLSSFNGKNLVFGVNDKTLHVNTYKANCWMFHVTVVIHHFLSHKNWHGVIIVEYEAGFDIQENIKHNMFCLWHIMTGHRVFLQYQVHSSYSVNITLIRLNISALQTTSLLPLYS